MVTDQPGSELNRGVMMDAQSEVKKFLVLLTQWLWLIILSALLAGAAAYFISIRLTPIYETTSDLLVIEGSSGSSSDYQDVLISDRLSNTVSDMMTNQDILQEIITINELDIELEDLEKSIEVSAISDTQLIAVKVEGEDPDEIAQIANSLVDVFIQRINAIQAERYSSSLSTLATQLKRH